MQRGIVYLAVTALAACDAGIVQTSDDGGATPVDAAQNVGPDRDLSGTVTDLAGIDASGTPVDLTTPAEGKGTIALSLEADKAAANDAAVSVGVPFPPGALSDPALVALFDAQGKEVSVAASVLARWPADNSLRSVLLAFKVTLGAGATAKWEVRYGTRRTAADPGAIAPNPDGPVAATLPARWLSASRVSGILLPVADNKRFAAYDTELERKLLSINWDGFGVDCGTTTNHRTYYDSPHAMFQLYARNGDTRHYRRARQESTWYRANELTFYANRTMAVQRCQAANWNPAVSIDWGVLRRMDSQGMLDDYLMTGDPAAREAVLALGEAYRQNLPALTGGREVILEVTERNMAWPMMGLDSYYAIDPRKEVLDALTQVVERAIAWQKRGMSGAFEHDIVRPDPDECSDGPKGGSPFMTALLADGLMDYHALTGDARVVEVMRKMATWYETLAITSNKRAFRYLWNCLSNSYDDAGGELNLLINHVFGATYLLTGDQHWLTFGDTMADTGIEDIFVGRPKQWSQSSRSFGRYLGYRALGATP